MAISTVRSVTVSPWAGPCGAVISGVDLAEPDLADDVVSLVRDALARHGVVFFRDQSLTPAQQVAFSHRLGPPSPVPFIEPIAEHPEVIAVVREPAEQQGFAFGGLWHSDFSFLPEPPLASMLYALEVPPYGSDTIWAHQGAAYRTLSAGMRDLVSPLWGAHSAVNAYSPKMQAVHDLFQGMTVRTSDEALRQQLHPVVRVHAATGNKVLFVNAQYTVGLHGFHGHEAKLILDHLFRHSTQEAFTCRWRWSAGDVALWDNAQVQHMAMADVSGHRRAMHRTTIAGEAPIPCEAAERTRPGDAT